MSSPGEKDDGSGFLSRWSQRKTAAKAESQPPSAQPLPSGEAIDPAGAAAKAGAESGAEPAPLPDIESLTFEGDFLPFMAKDVDPALRNQAMKKLFTDPHYGFDNMDKLDIYLDDYSKPDPIPLDMLRGLNQAKRLFLFDEEEKAQPLAAAARSDVAVPQEASKPAETTPEASQDGAGCGLAADCQSPNAQ